ncbi:hypothetical protein GCM10020367_33480 [Streptomyces sannanensis]|uniref:DUF4034 domain-containing protein n=1 Tax=Streptomyces sannanensis TaxID=285536 RepID=A0ABP6SCU6_9ACTN
MAARRHSSRFTPVFDPDFGDRPLTEARHDIAIGRWQGVRDLLRATGDDWPLRTHRIRLLAEAAADGSAMEVWRAAEPDSADAAVLRAALEVVRIFNQAIAAGRGAEVDRDSLDVAVMACLAAADAAPADPMPWVSLLTVARLRSGGVGRRELRDWWDELRQRDPYNMEAHVQMLRYFSARWHGTHGTMYDFARDAAGAAPPGSPLPVLVQIARVEEYRYVAEAAKGRPVRGFVRHWNHELAVTEVRRSWEWWIGRRVTEEQVPPQEVGELNYLTHAACQAGLAEQAGELFRLLGKRAARIPWSYTGDPGEQFTKYHEQAGL